MSQIAVLPAIRDFAADLLFELGYVVREKWVVFGIVVSRGLVFRDQPMLIGFKPSRFFDVQDRPSSGTFMQVILNQS